MVKELLTENKIRAGRELTQKLDGKNWPVRASLWLFVPDINQWQFILSSPRVNPDGPKKSYQTIQSAITEIPEVKEAIALSDIGLTDPDDPLIKLLQSAISTGPTLAGIRFTGNVINGHYIEDAYIYRISDKAPSGEET